MPLPLVTRKSLRDNEEKLKENVEKIQQALGVEWTYEFDFETILAKCTEEYVKNDLGGLFYKDIAGNIADCIERCSKDEMSKEALVEANTAQKIVLIPNDDKKFNAYWKYEFVNGELRVYFKPNICNVSDLSYFKLETIIPSPGVYSLPARINLKEKQEKFTESLEKVKAVTKMEWTLDESSLETLYPSLDKSYQERIGDIFSEILDYACENIVKRCGDEMVCEAVQEACPSGKIVFKFDAKQSEYWKWKFADGELHISFKSICNTSDNCYYDFEKLL
ncbi:hypothetical protein ACTFIZ_004006 [Dictyostelium cf. discoideum]